MTQETGSEGKALREVRVKKAGLPDGSASGGSPKAGRSGGVKGPRVEGGSREARRMAAAILDVLAGMRAPSEAAGVVGVSLPRYYALESRALGAMVGACEPAPKGRRSSPAREMGVLKKEVEWLRGECARRQALLRAAQRALGLSGVEGKGADGAGGRRRRRRTVRALRVVEQLQSEEPPKEESSSGETAEVRP